MQSQRNSNVLSRRILFLVAVMPSLCLAALSHPGGLYTAGQIAFVKSKISANREPWTTAYQRFIGHAGAALSHTPAPVVNLFIPGYYDDPEGCIAAMRTIQEDAQAAFDCALAWQLTGEAKYADKAISLIMAWNICTSTSGADGELIPCYTGNGFIFGLDLIWNYSGWNLTDRQSFIDGFVKKVYLPLSRNIHARGNNWGDWGTLGCLATYHLLGDSVNFVAEVNHLKSRVSEAISANGGMQHEIDRGDRGLWYTYFALAPMTAGCMMALNVTRTDLFSYVPPDGGTIKKAADYLLNWAKNPSGQVMAEKGYNLFEGLLDIYDEPAYESWVASQRPCERTGHHKAWVYPTLMKWDPFSVGPDTALYIMPQSLPQASVGNPYSQQLNAANGVSPLTWSITSGSLPVGLTLSSSGLVSGTPSGPEQSSNFTIQVRDGKGRTATQSYAIAVVSLLFSDRVYYGDAANYETSPAGYWSVGDDGSDKRLVCTETVNSGDVPGATAIIRDRSFSDFVLSFSARSAMTIATADFVAVFGYQNSANYYYMMFNATAGYNQLFKLVNGTRTLIATASQALITDVQYHEFTVICSDNAISISRDGTVVLTASDNTFGAGRIGVGTYNDPAWFDDIDVSPGVVGISAPAVRSVDLHRRTPRAVVWDSGVRGPTAAAMYDIRGKVVPRGQPAQMPAGVFFVK